MSVRQANGQFVKGVHSYRQPRPHWGAEWLRAHYVQQGLSTGDIAALAGVTDAAIIFWLDKHGIPRRTVSAARALKHWGAAGVANPMHGKVGALNPRYVDGSSPERQRMYARGEGRKFICSVLARDGYCCRRCSAPKAGRRSLHVHHVQPWAGNAALRFDASNAVTLCRSCHSWVHSAANVSREWLA